jgi:hypothetical protein
MRSLADIATMLRESASNIAGFGDLRAVPTNKSAIPSPTLTEPGFGDLALVRHSKSTLAPSPGSDILSKQMKLNRGRSKSKTAPKRLTAEEARKRFNAIAMSFDALDWQAIATYAEQRASAQPAPSASDARSGLKPALYKTRPKGEHLIDFLRREYRDKGVLGEHFSLADLRRYDPPCAKAIVLHESRRGPLPADVTLQKRPYRSREA